MKILIPIMILCMLLGCRDAEEENAGRGAQEEPADSASVTPEFVVPEWGDSISVEF